MKIFVNLFAESVFISIFAIPFTSISVQPKEIADIAQLARARDL